MQATRSGRGVGVLALLCLALGACAAPAGPPDASTMDAAGGACRANADCDDQLFCNGAERCMPGSAMANARGCVAGMAPCAVGTTCDETNARCGTGDAHCDEDGDGELSIACGGADCDDHDPYANHMRAEQCFGNLPDGRSAADHDEDCNPCTVAGAFPDGDADGDRFTSNQCSNPFPAGMAPVGCDAQQTRVSTVTNTVRGSDCNDAPSSSDGGVDGGAGGGANVHPNQVELCNGVDDNCDGQPDDVDPAASAACGTAPHATLRCALDHCVSVCTAPYLDCDGTATNGCEVDPLSDAAHCGSCANACVATGGVPSCNAGVCVGACVGSTHACGTACLADNGVASCGTSCTPCPTPANGSPTCDGIRCGIACNAGFHACSGACVDDTSPANCGASCTPCSVPSNATGVCAAGACTGAFVCDPGFQREGYGCFDGPRQLAPLSTATVTSLRPTFRWTLQPGTDGANVEVFTDRACTHLVTSFAVTGPSGAPSADLPARAVLFWRLHSRAGGVTTSAVSPVWEFWTGASSAPRATQLGTTVDVNGDGYADVLVGAHETATSTGTVYVYLGSATGLATAPATTLTGPGGINGNFGDSVASAGDVNGDGYADVLAGATTELTSTGRVYVYLGSATGLATTPATTLTGPGGINGSFGVSVASAGDVNSDGYADVLVGASGVSTSTGSVYLYLGSATGLATTPATTLLGPDGTMGNFGVSVASLGDLNNDGYADVLVGASGVLSNNGRVYVYYGNTTGLATTAATTRSGISSPGTYFGVSVASAGDVNRDGYADVLVGSPGSATGHPMVYVFSASATGLSTVATRLNGSGVVGFSAAVAGAGDLNGDGYADVLVGDRTWGIGGIPATPNEGQVWVYWGSATGLTDLSAIVRLGPDGANGYFGTSVAGAGDVDGDGYADAFVGASGPLTNTGRAYLYRGSATGLASAPATALTGPYGINGYFGAAVARLDAPRAVPASLCRALCPSRATLSPSPRRAPRAGSLPRRATRGAA